jgi:hypothetical protein
MPIANITSADSPYQVSFPVDSNVAGNGQVIVNVAGTGDVEILLPEISTLPQSFSQEVVVNVLGASVTGVDVTPATLDSVGTAASGASVSVATTEKTSKRFAVVAATLWSAV